MKKLFDSKIYKRSFCIYMVALFIVFTIICCILEKSILDSGLLYHEYRASKNFEQLEEKLDTTMSSVDNYILKLYSDSKLLEDFLYFWGKDAQGYITARLRNTYYGEDKASFLEDILNFLMEQEYHIRKIYFIADNGINSLSVNEQGNTSYEFFIEKEEYQRHIQGISKGYVYSKPLRKTEAMSEVLGNIVFIIDKSYLYNQEKAEFDHIYMFRNLKDEFVYNVKENQMEPSLGKMDHLNSDTGPNRFRWYKMEYRFTYYSERHEIGMMVEISRNELIESNLVSFLFVLFSVFAAYVVMLIFIGEHMSRESKFLSKIITSIQHAHKGNFKHIEIGKRKDEYSMIATELNIMADELDNFIKREYIFQIKQQETKMQALLYQINPHFLYNTLEIIKSCAIKNQDEETADALLYLGKMYRMLVKEDNVIPIKKELELLTCYLKIMEYKYSDCFYFQIDVDDSLQELDTVKFWMQPLVENFFVHGFDETSDFNILVIRGFETADCYHFEIVDNGQGVNEEQLERLNEQLIEANEDSKDKGIGIKNVALRLNYFYNNKCVLRLRNSDVKGLTIEVNIHK